MRVARAVFADACIGLADDFALREILGGEEAGASSDRENKGERKKALDLMASRRIHRAGAGSFKKRMD